MKFARTVGLTVVLLVGLIWLIDKIFLHQDNCLDAGGRWEVDSQSCDLGM